MGNKNWLVFANRDKCHHAEALYELGFVNWRARKSFKMSIGDYVYLYVSDERRVRFKTQVVAENCDRQDDKYWQDDAKGATLYNPTYKLEYRDEYKGHELDAYILRERCSSINLLKIIFSAYSQNSTTVMDPSLYGQVSRDSACLVKIQ
jgi:hypothetical protein